MTPPDSAPRTTRRTFLAQASAVGLVSALPQMGLAKAPRFPYKLVKTEIKVFPNKMPGPYTHFRIPSLVSTASGGLLAFCEGRFWDQDHGDTDILMKSSFDGGMSWSNPHQILVGTRGFFPGDTVNWRNPTAVYANGKVILMLIVDEGGEAGQIIREGNGTYTSRFFMMETTNPESEWSRVVRWSEPKEILLNHEFLWAQAGPGRGVFNNGRLIIPAATNNGPNSKSRAFALLSDDMGQTWRTSGRAGRATEVQIAALSDTTLLMSKRANKTQDFFTSKDNGETWGRLDQSGDTLVTPRVQTGIITDPQGRVIVSAPNHPDHRVDISLWSSDSFGETANWVGPLPLEPDNRCKSKKGCTNRHGYSCPAILPNGRLVILYEDSRGNKRYRKINVAILKPRK